MCGWQWRREVVHFWLQRSSNSSLDGSIAQRSWYVICVSSGSHRSSTDYRLWSCLRIVVPWHSILNTSFNMPLAIVDDPSNHCPSLSCWLQIYSRGLLCVQAAACSSLKWHLCSLGDIITWRNCLVTCHCHPEFWWCSWGANNCHNTTVSCIVVSVRGPNDSFGNQTGRMSNSSKTTEAKRHSSRNSCLELGRGKITWGAGRETP